MSKQSHYDLLSGFIASKQSVFGGDSSDGDGHAIAEDVALKVISTKTEVTAHVLVALRALAIAQHDKFKTVADCPKKLLCIEQRILENHRLKGNILSEVAGAISVNICCGDSKCELSPSKRASCLRPEDDPKVMSSLGVHGLPAFD